MSLAIEQTVTGFRVSEGTETTCVKCNTTLSECSSLTLRLRKESTHWSLVECYCISCAPIEFSQLLNSSNTELLIEGRLGISQDSLTQRTWLVLVAPRIVEIVRPARLVSY